MNTDTAPDIGWVFSDEALLVLHKPAGLLSVPGKGPDKQDCLSARVQAAYPDALVVHRLDQATSGLIVMARGLAAQQALNAAFANRLVHKRYEAVVQGNCQIPGSDSEGWHTIDLPILVDWPRRPLRKIEPLGGKASVTRWRCLAFDAANNTSRLELEPVTGRSHQLRVHLQAIGHPILGDALYAPPELQQAAPRLLLHARWLDLPHPVTGERVAFDCPCPF